MQLLNIHPYLRNMNSTRKFSLLPSFFLFLIAVLAFQTGFAQNRANHWYFRDGQGIDFSGPSPVFLQNGAIGPAEGTAAISDTSGNLQFYTDGVTIWDRFHTPMPNGTGLTGNISTTQSALIIPQPDSLDLYYVFTADQTCGPGGFRYSIVDMRLNGGRGDVLPNSKNVMLLSETLEKMAAVHHCNGKDIWITAIDYPTGDFHSWLITAQGLCGCPVVSRTGPVHGQGFGCMKFSNDGKRLVVVESGGTCSSPGIHSDLYDFDNNTGTVSFFQQIDTVTVNSSSAGGQYFGASFSPNNQLLYLSTGFSIYNGSGGISSTTAVVQYDLTATDIESSAVLIWDDAVNAGGCGSPMGSLQLAPDGKIYVGNHCTSYGIDVIADPDVLGTGCNYQHGIGLAPTATGAGYGITNFVESYLGQGVAPCDTILSADMCLWLNEIHCPVVGVEADVYPSGLTIYPNPAGNILHIKVPNSGGAIYSCKIYNLQGRLVRDLPELLSDTFQIERGMLENGLYLLEIAGAGQRFTAKVWFR